MDQRNCSVHEHRSFRVRTCPVIPVNLGRIGRLFVCIVRRIWNFGQFNHRLYDRRLLAYAIFLRVPFRIPIARLKKEFSRKKINIVPVSLSHPSSGARFSRLCCAPGRCTLRSVPEPRPISASVFPPTFGCVGCSHPSSVRAENFTACAVSVPALIKSGAFQCPAWVCCYYGSNPAIPEFPHVLQSCVNRLLVASHRRSYFSHTSDNFGARARCRQIHVRQFRGKPPLPPSTASGNFEARARCHHLYVR